MAGFMKRLFRGAETPTEEKKEATALKSGKISKKQYVAGEKAEGHGAGAAKKAAAIKSGKLSPAAYAKGEQKEKAMKCGGKVKKMADGGMPTQAAAGIARRPEMPAKSNAGGAMRGLDRAAAMSGRAMPATGRPTTAGAPTGAGRPMAKGGKVKKMAKGGGVESKGKTRGKVC